MKKKNKIMKKIIIFGGTNFIGKAFVERYIPYLKSKGQPFFMVFIVRGTRPFPFPALLQEGVVKIIKVDRKKSQQLEDALRNEESLQGPIDLLMDFSSYGHYVSFCSIVDAFLVRTKTYVFISSDSIYEVCEKKVNAHEPWGEEDAIRPASEEARQLKRKWDKYGDNKLRMEEYLDQSTCTDVQMFILRLPDVLGKEDPTDRCWKLFLLAVLSSAQNIPLTLRSQENPLSFVLVEDVANAIMSLLCTTSHRRISVYNLAHPHCLTFVELLTAFHHAYFSQDSTPHLFIDACVEDTFEYFPSVSFGTISIAHFAKDFPAFQWSSLPNTFAAYVHYYSNLIKVENEDSPLLEFSRDEQNFIFSKLK